MSNQTVIVPAQPPLWYSGPLLQPGESTRCYASGTGSVGPNTAPPLGRPVNAGGALPPIPTVGNAADFGFYAAFSTPSINVAGSYSVVYALKQEGLGPPDTWDAGGGGSWNSGTSPITYGQATPYRTVFTITNNAVFAQRVWLVFNGVGGTFYWSEYTGEFAVSFCNVITAPDLSASLAASPLSVILSWSDVGALSYSLYRDGLLLKNLISGTTYTDSAVLPNTTYRYAVRALSACETSDDSNLVTIVTPITPSSWVPDPTPDPTGWDEQCAGDNVAWDKSCAGTASGWNQEVIS